MEAHNKMEINRLNSNSDIPSDIVKDYFYKLLKLRKQKLNLYFNKTCRRNKVIPKYINIKIKSKSIAAQETKQKAENMWLNKVIKELYTKINNITIKVYNTQLKISKHYHPLEYNQIIETVETKVNKQVNQKSKTIKKKLKSLKQRKAIELSNNSLSQNITHKFNNRIENKTEIEFNHKEIIMLEKGLQYCIQPTNNTNEHNKHLLNIENSILKTNYQNQQEIRATLITEISRSKIKENIRSNIPKIAESKTINNIRKKLQTNNSIITKADKGNTIVIMEREEYNKKIDEYINNNNIEKLPTDPTNDYNTKIKQIINKSTNILSDRAIRYNKTIKPTAPSIKGLPKIHKENTPIRPLINFTTAPTYKIAKHINKILNQHIKFQHNYSLKNTLELIDKITKVKIPHKAKLASFDITNMYTNIPIKETIEITKNLLTQSGIKTAETDDIINLITEITKQNYFIHNNETYTQTKGLPMGSPLSGTLAEIYLNNFENKYIINEINKYNRNIIYWYRYVDDIILLFNGTNRQLDKLHQYINNLQPSIKFTLENEKNNKINFLDLTIKNDNSKHTFKIYRKPTQTDHTIHNHSHHPYQHKISAYNHMTHRLNSVPMNKEDYDEELNIIKQIANKNGYKPTLIDKINSKIKAKLHQQLMTTLTKEDNNKNEKYISVEYNKTTSNIIQKILNRYGYKTAYRNNNKIEQKLRHTGSTQPLDTGVYKINCNDCTKFYIGQTGRSFEQRFKEHINDTKKPDPKSNYAQHIINENHTYTNLETNLTILHRNRKGQTLNRLEEIEIYRNKDNNDLLNDKINTKTNRLYEYIINNTDNNKGTTTKNSINRVI